MTIKICNFRNKNFFYQCSKKYTVNGCGDCNGEENCIDYQIYINTLKEN